MMIILVAYHFGKDKTDNSEAYKWKNNGVKNYVVSINK